jgi:hypothetical protein
MRDSTDLGPKFPARAPPFLAITRSSGIKRDANFIRRRGGSRLTLRLRPDLVLFVLER